MLCPRTSMLLICIPAMVLPYTMPWMTDPCLAKPSWIRSLCQLLQSWSMLSRCMHSYFTWNGFLRHDAILGDTRPLEHCLAPKSYCNNPSAFVSSVFVSDSDHSYLSRCLSRLLYLGRASFAVAPCLAYTSIKALLSPSHC